MKLPNAERARVDREKITDYLLSPVHPDGSSKIIEEGEANPRLITAHPA
jgi:hypothetical protein